MYLLAYWNCSPSCLQWPRNVNCGSSLQRCYCWHYIFPSTRVPCRNLKAFAAWRHHHHSTIGHRMGHSNHVSYNSSFSKLKLTSKRYFIGYGCSFIGDDNSTASFRTAWGIQFVPCVFFMIGLPFLPESPRWLVKVDRVDEALHILAHIQANGNLEDPYVVAEYEEIITVLTAERTAPKGWRKFVYNGMWRRTLAGFSVQAWQQLSGANVSRQMICSCRHIGQV
jgi:hypothetical protein